MLELTSIPRITQLLGQVKVARDALDGVDSRDPESVVLQRRLDALHLEIGRYVDWLMRQDRSARRRIAAEAEDQRRGGGGAERIDEETAVPPPRRATRPITTDDSSPDRESVLSMDFSWEDEGLVDERVAEPASELKASDIVERVAGSEGDLPIEALPAPEDEDDDTEAESFDLERDLGQPSPGEADWVHALRELLRALGGPHRAREASAQVAQADRILHSTTGMEVHWGAYPTAVQRALLGLLGSMARDLQSTIEDDVGIRLALGRLERFRAARELPTLPSLDRDGKPEYKSWSYDAQASWSSLTAWLRGR